MKLNNKFSILSLFFLSAFMLISCNGKLSQLADKLRKAPKDAVQVCVSMPDSARWISNLTAIEKESESYNVVINSAICPDGKGNHQQQFDMIKKRINEGDKYIILAAVDTDKALEIVNYAKDNNVSVILFDRPIPHAPADLLITVNAILIGEKLAKYAWENQGAGRYLILSGDEGDRNSFLLRKGSLDYLRPMISSGQVKIVSDQSIPDWSSENAEKIVRNLLEKGVRFDAVICPSDLPAVGVIEALKSYQLNGKVLVTGQDGVATAIEAIKAGNQHMTIFKDMRLYVLSAVNAVIQMEENLIPFYNNRFDNGSEKIPWHEIESLVVDKDNIGILDTAN